MLSAPQYLTHLQKSQEPQAIKTSPAKQRQGSASSSSELTSPPVTIRWDSAKHDDGVSTTISKITFPVTGPHGEEDLAKLVRDCEPASFGFRGQDVLDDSYRKAGKMDRSCFSSDFCPYELGIIDTIAQILLQNTEDGPINTRGIKAELYKLNVSSSAFQSDGTDDKFLTTICPTDLFFPIRLFQSSC